MSADLLKGRPTMQAQWEFPKAMEAEVLEWIASHEKWMKETHQFGVLDGTPASGGPRMLEYFFTFGTKMNEALDPSKGLSDTVVARLVETYVGPEDIQAHIAMAGKSWSAGFKKMNEYGKYNVHMQIGHAVYVSQTDCIPSVKVAKGNPSLFLSFCVPPEREAEFDRCLTNHETFMRSTHTLGGSELTYNAYFFPVQKPKLTSYYVSKGQEMKNAMEPKEGVTGNFRYNLIETYELETGVADHFGLAPRFEYLKYFFEGMELPGFAGNIFGEKVIATMHD